MNFRITGLPVRILPICSICRTANSHRKAPFAVSPMDASPVTHAGSVLRISTSGDELLLVNYEHHPVDSPYRMRFAIYVRKGDATYDAVDQVPEQLRFRMLAVRSYDAGAMMQGWELIDGRELEGAVARLFADAKAAYLHIHFAAPGCYAARVDRA